MEDLEQIMRRIHVLFAKCEPYGNKDEGKIIVPKKEVFRLLEKLNYAVIRLMDEYEGTQESRERGMRDFYQEGEKIKAAAQSGADDVYAASLIYTDNMLEELSDVLALAKEELWEQYARMAERLDRQARVLGADQEEIHQQLGAMAQSGKYLKLIERENIRLKRVEQARVQEEDEEEAYRDEYWYEEDYEEEEENEEYEEVEETKEEEAESGETKEEEPAWEMEASAGAEEEDQKSAAGVFFDEEEMEEYGNIEDAAAESAVMQEEPGGKAPEEEADLSADGGNLTVGSASGILAGAASGSVAGAEKKPAKKPAADIKRKPVQNPQKKPVGKRRVSAGHHARMSPDLEAEWAEEEAKRKVRKIGTAIYQDVGQPYDPPAKHVTYEVKVNQAYLDLVEGGVDLDAEYYQWKKEQEQAAAGIETDGDDEIGEEVQILDNPGIHSDSDKKEKKKRGLKFGKRA